MELSSGSAKGEFDYLPTLPYHQDALFFFRAMKTAATRLHLCLCSCLPFVI